MNKHYAEIISADAERINQFLETCPKLKVSEESPWELVLEAEKYALSAGGKRVRPVLAVEFYKLFSNSETAPDYVYEAAAVLEMTHTFSLIHDDMPEMDNDDLRRGKLSTHVKFGTDVGLLAGDGLAILPYEIISEMYFDGKLTADIALKLIKVLSESAGNCGMIAGQMLDIWSENRADQVDDRFLRQMSQLKTGRMLEASCLFGAIMAGADGEMLKSAQIYAKNVGLAFQIVDDVLDVISDTGTLGKPIGSDNERKKPTFVDVLGIDNALIEAKKLSIIAADELTKYPRSELLREFALSLVERKK